MLSIPFSSTPGWYEQRRGLSTAASFARHSLRSRRGRDALLPHHARSTPHCYASGPLTGQNAGGTGPETAPILPLPTTLPPPAAHRHFHTIYYPSSLTLLHTSPTPHTGPDEEHRHAGQAHTGTATFLPAQQAGHTAFAGTTPTAHSATRNTAGRARDAQQRHLSRSTLLWFTRWHGPTRLGRAGRRQAGTDAARQVLYPTSTLATPRRCCGAATRKRRLAPGLSTTTRHLPFHALPTAAATCLLPTGRRRCS